MTTPSNLVLFGFMGTGKSAAGRRAARALGFRFVDMDEVIEEREHLRISEIFARHGEPYFRDRERALARELAQGERQVIATGGGVVLNPDNLAELGRTGVLICLSASVEAILSRVGHDQNRPLLAEGDRAGKIRDLLGRRQALYDAVPHQVDTTRLTPDQVAERIVEIYRSEQSAA
jgi:shikimate kinase